MNTQSTPQIAQMHMKLHSTAVSFVANLHVKCAVCKGEELVWKIIVKVAKARTEQIGSAQIKVSRAAPLVWALYRTCQWRL